MCGNGSNMGKSYHYKVNSQGAMQRNPLICGKYWEVYI